MKNLKAKLLTSAILISVPIFIPVSASAASSSICNSSACNNPSVSTVFGQIQDRQLSRPTPINICETLNNWKADAVIQLVGGVLKVNWVYTLVPSVICHLVGWAMKYRFLTAGAVLLTWVVIYFLGLTGNTFVIFIPIAVLAFFQINEKRLRRYFSRGL